MINTSDLIEKLSHEGLATKMLPNPRTMAGYLLAIIAVYGISTQCVLGLRPDLATQLTRPLFAGEIILLSSLLITSTIASVLAMYPDAYQKTQFLKAPYIVFLFLFILVGFQFFMPEDIRMIMPEVGHGMKCTICIASFAITPSAIIFTLLRRGAIVSQLQAGVFAALASSSIGCITLRLSELNDSVVHLVSWHYIPTLLFAMIGAFIGKLLLKW